MFESLLTVSATELGKVIFEQVLKLGQSAAEDYVKEFFKSCLGEGIATAKPDVTKKAVAGALKAFLLLITDELEDHELSKAEIRDRYDLALTQFLNDNSVKLILGKAFEKDCKSIDATALATIWQQSLLREKTFPTMPEGFDWPRIATEYLKKVRRIVRETSELRSLLETQLLEDIARNTTQLSPGFDVAKYRDSLQCSYGHLKLYAIDTTDRVDALKLWNMFIEQTVREALPPTRYELPLDLKRQLQEQGQLEDLSPEALEYYRQDYFQQPTQKVLSAVADSQWAVILGDPGAGKSTLLQYLALEWVEGKTQRLPLLIELREYAVAQSKNFLDFLHHGRGVDWQFDQLKLHQHLLDQPTLVMFDGLDEVFDRATQAAIVDDIIRFAQQYPSAQILITSRIIGYNPDRLQHAGFRQFTIQPLDTDEIHAFIERWYDLAMGTDPDRERLKQRLKDAIANSNAIQNLADNPLLLTMMAILNRRQELPRDRADLYDQASRVLLYHWDVDHKRLQLPMDAIGRREKQEMLRAIAYEMQAGEEGLKGNLISAEHLTRILTNYLRDQGFSEPREKAYRLIDQLRHRNWILCDRGADTYGFVHRTFLEYFCALEIVHRFEKQRTLTFKQLRDEIFGQHWQEETWREVLRLICGAINVRFTAQLIEFLIGLKGIDAQEKWFSKQEIGNLQLALECLGEVPKSAIISAGSKNLFESIREKVEDSSIRSGDLGDIKTFANVFGSLWEGDSLILDWLKLCLEGDYGLEVHTHLFAVCALIKGWRRETKTFQILMDCVQKSYVKQAAKTAALALVEHCREHPHVLLFLKHTARESSNYRARGAALSALAQQSKEDPDTFSLLKIAQQDENYYIRQIALEALGGNWCDDPDILNLLKNAAYKDQDWRVRGVAVETLIRLYSKNTHELPNILYQIAKEDPYKREADFEENPRFLAAQGFVFLYPNHPKMFELLNDRAANDPDNQFREWAQKQLKILNLNL